MKVDVQIVVMRCLAIVMIVFHHCITVFYLFPPSDLTSIGFGEYGYLVSKIAKVYGLGIFTFISGFLLAYGKHNKLSWNFIGHKSKKILLPCFITALVYKIFFSEFCMSRNTIMDTHLWYLPMIFVFYLMLPIIKSENFKTIIGGIVTILLLFIVLGRLTDIKLFYSCVMYLGYFLTGVFMNKYYSGKVVGKKHLLILSVLTMLFINNGTIYPTTGIVYNSGVMNNLGVAIYIICLYYFVFYLRVSNLYNKLISKYACWMALGKKAIYLVSERSFLIYLLHIFVINLCIKYVPRDIPCFKYFFVLLSFCLAISLPILFATIWNSIIARLRRIFNNPLKI